MATERVFICEGGSHKEWPALLFDALKDIASGHARRCGKCNRNMQLHLTFDFGMESGPHEVRVLDAFLPEDPIEWPNKDGGLIRFYPFLIMVEAIKEGWTEAWLPYWHTVTDKTGKVGRKYGQWAPFMGEDALASLVRQARAKGYSI